MCCSTAYTHERAGVRPVMTLARVGEQIGLPAYARSNQTACGERDIASRCGVSAGAPVRDQSPQPMSSTNTSTMLGDAWRRPPLGAAQAAAATKAASKTPRRSVDGMAVTLRDLGEDPSAPRRNVVRAAQNRETAETSAPVVPFTQAGTSQR